MTDANLPLQRRYGYAWPTIGFLAIITILRACGVLFVTNRGFVYAAYLRLTGDDMQLFGPPVPMMVLENLMLIVLLASGIGLVLRAKWGWWLTGFVYAFIVCRSIYMMVMLGIRGEELQQTGDLIGDLGFSVKIVIFAALVYFLYRRSVLDLFGLSDIPKVKVATVQVLSALLTLILTAMFASVIIWNYGGTMVLYGE